MSLTLLVLTLICIPTLLCCKPCLLHRGAQDINKKKQLKQDEFSGVQLVATPTRRKEKDKAKNSDEEEELLLNSSPIA